MMSLTAAFLAGCVTTSGDFCDVSRPIYIDSLSGKTKAEKQAILENNEKGEKLCGWKP